MAKKRSKDQLVLLSEIRTDGETQSRVQLSEPAIKEYQEGIEKGDKLPPALVFHDGASYWLADGFQRYFAYRNAGHDRMPCIVQQGTKVDAQWASYAANPHHGVPRTNGDKQKAVKAALQHPQGKDLTDVAIGEHCRVSSAMVGKIRKQLEGAGNIKRVNVRTARDGRKVTTENIGRSHKAKAAVSAWVPGETYGPEDMEEIRAYPRAAILIEAVEPPDDFELPRGVKAGETFNPLRVLAGGFEIEASDGVARMLDDECCEVIEGAVLIRMARESVDSSVRQSGTALEALIRRNVCGDETEEERDETEVLDGPYPGEDSQRQEPEDDGPQFSAEEYQDSPEEMGAGEEFRGDLWDWLQREMAAVDDLTWPVIAAVMQTASEEILGGRRK